MTKRMFWCVLLVVGLGLWGSTLPQSTAQDALLEATRSDFQKIPIHVMDFGNVNPAKDIPFNHQDEVTKILKADLTRSQVFSVAKLPLSKGEFSGNKCVGLNPVHGDREKRVTVSTWGRLGKGRPSTNGTGLIFDACADDTGDEELLFGKRYFSIKSTETLLRLMTHRWADELVYRYTGEQGIARTKIAYVAEEGLGKELFVMDYDGYGPQQVTANGYLNLMPTWAPDRKSLVYTAYRQRKTTKSFGVNFPLAKKKLWSMRQVLILPHPTLWTGNFIVYSSGHSGNSDIYSLELPSMDTHRLTSHRSADLSPSWSPDGSRLAFTSDRGGRPQVYIMNADGSNVRRLTYQGDYNAAPAWSPKGDWIAYVCRIPGEGFKLCRITLDGRQVVQITKGKSIDDSPSWSPNGRHLVFSSVRRGKATFTSSTATAQGWSK